MNTNTRLGILGSGQLARMTALAAYELGIEVAILADTHDAPAALVSSNVTIGSIYNKEDVLKFTQTCDYVTLENEFIPQDILNAIESQKSGKLFPSAESFKLIGDKISEKNTFQNAGIQVAPFAQVNTIEDIQNFATLHSYPVVLKSARGGYDGYGNALIRSVDDCTEGFKKLGGGQNELLVEKFIHYQKEVAIIAAQNSTNIIYYPIVETLQENHICHFTIGPAKISAKAQQTLLDYTEKALKALNTRGLFGFEFFLDEHETVYLNESAPRPHNSGHYTQLACETSQFHNIVRAILDLPLGSTQESYKAYGILNLLGTHSQVAELKPLDVFLNSPRSRLELYGKKHSKPGRKMGHFIYADETQEKVLQHLQNLKKNYTL